MSTIKINTTRQVRLGAVFHYTPFIFHVLFPEILKGVYRYDTVIRERSINQTIGLFRDIYTEVMGNKNIELSPEDFSKIEAETLNCEFYNDYWNINDFNTFRNFIFNRYDIDQNRYDQNYPEILLIKRHDRVELLDEDLKNQLPRNVAIRQIDPITNQSYIKYRGDKLYGDAASVNWFLTNGKERREMDRIDDVESYMKDIYKDRFGSVYLEIMPFREQVKYFNSAKTVIYAHGGCMANLLFSKTGTQAIESARKGGFHVADSVFQVLGHKHIKCPTNQFGSIIETIENNIPR